MHTGKDNHLPLSAAHIRQAFSRGFELPLFFFPQTDSTNREARRYAALGEAGPALFVAETQTEGRGRQGKSFYSPGGSGLYLSLLLPPPERSDSVLITSAASVAVARAILRTTGKEVGIKWVNDLYYRERKAVGILAEAVPGRENGDIAAVVLGVGVNVTTGHFPKELSSAGALYGEDEPVPKTVRSALAAAIAEELVRMMRDLKGYCFLEEYRRRSIVLGREIVFWQNGSEYTGVATKINEAGALSVRLTNGEIRTLDSGEITLRVR